METGKTQCQFMEKYLHVWWFCSKCFTPYCYHTLDQDSCIKFSRAHQSSRKQQLSDTNHFVWVVDDTMNMQILHGFLQTLPYLQSNECGGSLIRKPEPSFLVSVLHTVLQHHHYYYSTVPVSGCSDSPPQCSIFSQYQLNSSSSLLLLPYHPSLTVPRIWRNPLPCPHSHPYNHHTPQQHTCTMKTCSPLSRDGLGEGAFILPMYDQLSSMCSSLIMLN